MLYIRVDMNNVIATGHMMRCLSVADAARDMGLETTFIVADEQALPLLEKRGYPSVVLNTKWDDMDSELPVLKKIIEENHIVYLLIDSYKVTQNYLKELTAIVKTLYIDDLCVDENCRGKHIGKALYEAAVNLAKEKECYNLTLNVWSCNSSAMEFYKSMGLVPQKVGMEKIL